MLRFLNGDLIRKAVQDLIEQSEHVEFAVAYWGHKAIGHLKIDPAKPTRIICDLLSGGCNPHEIGKLLQGKYKQNVQVRHLDRLHAKVYLGSERVICGSANASANGLGDESWSGSIEAAIETDCDTRASASAWFEECWRDAKENIKPLLLKQAQEAWLSRQPRGDLKRTVLEVLQKNPSWFRKRVWITRYGTSASQAAEAKFDKVKAAYYSPKQLEAIAKAGRPLYDWGASSHVARPGDVVLDMWEKKSYEIIEYVQYQKNKHILLMKPVTNVLGLRFPANERKSLGQTVRALALRTGKEDFDCNLEELHELIDLQALFAEVGMLPKG